MCAETSITRFSQVAQEETHAQPAEKNCACPLRRVGIDLDDQILKAAANPLHVQKLPGLGERIQAVQALP
jgi:hypothetical protein